MSYNRCAYHKCYKTSLQTSMFRFPVKDKRRLLLWIRNSGNKYLDSLTINQLDRRYICAAHFPPSSINHGISRTRLIGPAIPIHFATEHDIEEGTLSSAMTEVKMETDIPSPPVLKVKKPVECPEFQHKFRVTYTNNRQAEVKFKASEPVVSVAPECLLYEDPVEATDTKELATTSAVNDDFYNDTRVIRMQDKIRSLNYKNLSLKENIMHYKRANFTLHKTIKQRSLIIKQKNRQLRAFEKIVVDLKQLIARD